jgi:glycosyltransferase involved in cell wall biosynthesis
MKQNQLSCIIPVGPGQKSNENLIASIKSDPGTTDFILVFDSPPTEIRTELIELAKLYPSITTVDVCTKNPGGSRNAGLVKCQTEWVAFFDADDLFNIRTVNDYLDKCRNNPDAIVFSFVIQKYAQEIKMTVVEDLSGEICDTNRLQVSRYPGIWRWIFRYEAIKNYRFKEFRMGEDIIFLIEFLKEKRRIFFSPQVSYTYTENISLQLTRSHEAKQELLQALRCSLSLLSRQNIKVYNCRMREELTSLLFYSAMIHLELGGKLRALTLMSCFSVKSVRNLALAYRVITARLGLTHES